MRSFLIIGIVAIFYMAYVNSDACVQCDSTTDPKCAQSPSNYLAKECATNSSSKCYSRILNGATIRGCAVDLDNATLAKCNNELECLVCSFMEGCNRDIFPRHRAQCLQCSGNLTGNCSQDVYLAPTVCPTYKLGDKCYVRKTDKNDTQSFQRGCLSSAQANKLCLVESNCFTCEGNGCNAIAANSLDIPFARDSAGIFTLSLSVMFAAIFAQRYL